MDGEFSIGTVDFSSTVDCGGTVDIGGLAPHTLGHYVDTSHHGILTAGCDSGVDPSRRHVRA